MQMPTVTEAPVTLGPGSVRTPVPSTRPQMRCLADGDCEEGPFQRALASPPVPAPMMQSVPRAARLPRPCAGSSGDADAADCADGVCVGAPTIDDASQFHYQCGAGRICVDNACVNICAGDEDCGSGLTCVSGMCQPASECVSSEACAEGQSCVDGRCLDACTSIADCPGELCAEDGFCRP